MGSPTAGYYVRAKGARSLKHLSKHSGFHYNTLRNWFSDSYDRAHKLDPAIDRYVAYLDRMAEKQES